QTEGWVKSNGGRRLADVIRRNAGKVGGSTIETPNSYRPGTESVSEMTAQYAQSLQEGRARQAGLYYDHREAPADTDMSDAHPLGLGHTCTTCSVRPGSSPSTCGMLLRPPRSPSGRGYVGRGFAVPRFVGSLRRLLHRSWWLGRLETHPGRNLGPCDRPTGR